MALFHSEVAFRDCQHCQKYLYDEEAGKVREHNEQLTELILPPPCRSGKCAKGTPDNPKTLSLKNQQTYQHWKECKAVGQFPNDDIVRKHAAVIQELVDQSQEY
ncbi:MAG: hypothetical protein K0U90_05610 [Planctomycetes bacterium]|nr:hypothetical protein [Planctomycetota bacterium]